MYINANICYLNLFPCIISTKIIHSKYHNVSLSVFHVGDIDSVFKSIVANHRNQVTVLSSSPWVVTIDNFLSDYETELLRNIIKELQELELEEEVNRYYSEDDLADTNHFTNKNGNKYMFSGWCMKHCMDQVCCRCCLYI